MNILPYAIFGGYFYQTNSGGFDNICDFAETLEEAIHIYETLLYTKQNQTIKYDWAHIVEIPTKSIVIDSRHRHNKINAKSKL